MHNWLKNEITKLMEKRNKSITDIKIKEKPIDNGFILIINIDFTDIDSGSLRSEDIIVPVYTKIDSFKDILNNIENQINYVIKKEEIA